LALVTAMVLGGGLFGAAPAAHAQKLYESTRYQSVNQPIANWTTYAPNGTPIGKDPNCPTFPGIRRSSKVWASAYGLDEPLHSAFRMQFHTTYSTGVASAMLSYQNAGVPVSCATLNAYQGADAIGAREWASCLILPQNRPTRWCQVALNNPNDPTINAHLADRCPGGPAGAPGWPAMWHEWHNLPDYVGNEARLYNIDVIKQFASWLSSLGLSLNMPVYLDDVTILGGVSNFNQDTAQPTYGNAWYGYGQITSPGLAELLTRWYDQAAWNIGQNPIVHPVAAHNAVDNAINNGQHPVGLGNLTRAQLYSQIMCPYSPTVESLLDVNGGHSLAAVGEDLSGWVQAETGETLCQKVHEQPKFANVVAAACNNTFVGLFFAVVDNGNCMNRPSDPVANLLGVDLGCNRNIHLARLFSQMKAFLGG
jgi:hypothetical protein